MKRPEELRNDCIDIIVEKLSERSLSPRVSELKIWMTENCFEVLFDFQYTTETMIDRVKDQLANKGHVQYENLPMSIQILSQPLTNQFFEIKENEIYGEIILRTNATVREIPNRGTMHKSSYVLAFEEGRVYNIGRSVFPPINGSFRENYIAIKENETDDSQKEINQHVSGAHADIKVINGQHHLHATSRGFRLGTKISREGEEIKLTSDYIYEPLQDQDIIILGNAFMMRYCKQATTSDNNQEERYL